jgi:ankyrin repeat protein
MSGKSTSTVPLPEEMRGWTPLHMSAARGQLVITGYLLEGGAVVDAGDAEGRTPLWWAAQQGHLAVVMALVEAKGQVNRAAGDGQTPLFAAAHASHAAVVHLLLEAGADVNCTYCQAAAPSADAQDQRLTLQQ